MVAPEPAALHDHEWRLVCTDGDGTIEVKEFLCLGCSAVLIEG